MARTRPDLTAFFGCLYYGALRPEEAIALRLADCYLPAPRLGNADPDQGRTPHRQGLDRQRHQP